MTTKLQQYRWHRLWMRDQIANYIHAKAVLARCDDTDPYDVARCERDVAEYRDAAKRSLRRMNLLRPAVGFGVYRV